MVKIKRRKVNSKELEELEKIISPEDDEVIQRILNLQVNKNKKTKYKQFFVRFPKDLEELLDLKEGKNVRFIIKVPHPTKKEKPTIKMEIIE